MMSNDQTVSDEELVNIIRTRDASRYRDIVKRYQEKLIRYALYLMHDEHLATDVVQEAFIKAYINLNGFDTKRSFSSWIYRIVHNEAINWIHKYRRETSLANDMDIQSDENIEEAYIQQEVATTVKTCLKEMPVLYREPLALYYIEGKSYEEISDIIRIPMGTVATRINRAKGIMKTLCKKNKHN